MAVMFWIRRILAWLWANSQNLAWVVGLVVRFSIPAWAVHATDFLQQYAPASWVGAGFAGVFVMAASWWVVSRALLALQLHRFRNKVADRTTINPLDTVFRSARIHVRDLSPPIGGVVTDKTFIDCEIIGPANLMFVDCIIVGTAAKE